MAADEHRQIQPLSKTLLVALDLWAPWPEDMNRHQSTTTTSTMNEEAIGVACVLGKLQAK